MVSFQLCPELEQSTPSIERENQVLEGMREHANFKTFVCMFEGKRRKKKQRVPEPQVIVGE